MGINGTFKKRREKEAYLTAQTGTLISRHSEIKKSADLWANQKSALLFLIPTKMQGVRK